MVGGNAAALYGFDLDALRAARRARSAPGSPRSPSRSAPARCPLDADKCPAFVGYEFAAE